MKITNGELHEAIERAQRGIVDADLGGGIIKQRIPRLGAGRSGGYLTIVAYRSGLRAVFLFGFAKNVRDNISKDELKNFRDLATLLSELNDDGIDMYLAAKKLTEIGNDEEV